jgi:hypothetical protein
LILLFAASDDDSRMSSSDSDIVHDDYACDASDVVVDDVDGRYDDDAVGKRVGMAILSISSSPILRSVPLILFFVSSTAFVIGMVMAHGEIGKFVARIRKWEECGRDISRRLTDVILMGGMADNDDTVARTEEPGGGGALWKRAEGMMECMDGIVLDDVLRRLAKTGMEVSMGALGGMLLYSVPDEYFVCGPFVDAGSARRRLIRAADPYLERILFRPGGAWDILPHNLAEYLMKRRLAMGHGVKTEAKRISDSDIVVGSRGGKEMALVGIVERTTIGDDSTYDGDDSLDSPMVSGASPGLSRDDEPQLNGAVGVGATIPRQNDNDGECSKKVVEDELLVTTPGSDVVRGEMQIRQYSDGEDEDPTSTPPELRLRQILHRTSIVAAFLFSCHLCRSPSTRRAWGSAANFLTSLGLASTAIAAGVVSASLSGANNGTTIHPILEIFYYKVLEGSLASRVHGNVDRLVVRLRDEIKRNKRLQTALAISVLYWISSLTRKGARRSCNFRQQET